MEKHILELNEKIRLLNLLLVNEISERMLVAKDHHGKSADWVSVKMKLERIQMGSLKVETALPEIITEINDIFANARIINRAIHPKEVDVTGLLAAFNHGVKKIESAYELNIDFGQIDFNKPELTVVTSLALYRVFMRSVECLALAKYKNVVLVLEVRDSNLFFSATGSNKRGKPTESEKLATTLELIKAGISWQNVVVLDKTNWRSCFCFSYPLIASRN